MLAKRVIPCMDVKDGRVVKGVNFVNLRDAGDPIELAQRYDEQRADEVIFLDITATSDKRETTVDLASRASAQLHLPYCVGGGFRSVADIRRMIAAGADKVSVNSAAVDIPVIASGGVGKLEHFAEGIIDGEADAVLAASVFHFGEFTVTQVKEYMRSQGIPVRL